jgi:hypothetical protein
VEEAGLCQRCPDGADDIAEVQTEDGKLHMFVAVDRTSKFAFTDCRTKSTPSSRTSIQFTKREGGEAYWTIPFDRLCDALGTDAIQIIPVKVALGMPSSLVCGAPANGSARRAG